ncbi:MAG: 50S ribosomal protein L18 [Patescibacteria group bacterium]
MQKSKLKTRNRRHKRVRAKITGTANRPRLSVFRSNKYINLQLIDDQRGKTIISYNDSKIKEKMGRIEKARKAGRLLAELARNKRIKKIVFDRGGYKYHGIIKAVAEGLREKGLEF